MTFDRLLQIDRNAKAAVHQAGTLRAVARKHDDLKKTGTRLWIVQGLLAALFLFAGVMKLVMPIDLLAAQSHLPGPFMKFIGLAETLGAIGLILPGVLRIRPGLTPLAAAGLVIIMIGATVTTLLQGQVAPAIVPLVVGVLAGSVAYGRWQRASHRGSSHRSELQTAA